MKRFAIIAALLLAPALAQGQPDRKKDSKSEATKQENEAVISIVKCMVEGLPEDWSVAIMDVNLEKPFDDTGGVRYLMGRGDAREATEEFEPCDVREPARTLIGARKFQSKGRQGWIGARVTVFRDGKYGIRYGYPAAAPAPAKK